MYYYINRTTRMVRVESDPISFDGWELVSLDDWNAFRVETFNMKRSKRK